MAVIDLLVPVGKRGAEHAEYFRKISEKLRGGYHCINYLTVESYECDRLPEAFHCIASTKNSPLNTNWTSACHAVSIHEGLKKCYGEYIAVCDSDIVFLTKGWDNILVDELEQTNCFGFGGNLKEGRCPGFPTVMFIAFKQELNRPDLMRFTPVSEEHKYGRAQRFNVPKDEVDFWKLPEGTLLKKDTGWEIPLLFRKAGLSGVGLRKSWGHKSSAILPFINDKQKEECSRLAKWHMQEFTYKNGLYGSHLRASIHVSQEEWLCRTWRERCEMYLMQRYGLKIE